MSIDQPYHQWFRQVLWTQPSESQGSRTIQLLDNLIREDILRKNARLIFNWRHQIDMWSAEFCSMNDDSPHCRPQGTRAIWTHRLKLSRLPLLPHPSTLHWRVHLKSVTQRGKEERCCWSSEWRARRVTAEGVPRTVWSLADPSSSLDRRDRKVWVC